MNDASPNNSHREAEILPPKWAWTTPLEIGEAALGKMLDRAKHTEGRVLPYVRNLNIRWGALDLSDLLTMRFRDDELARYELRRGDLLICEGGEPGRCAVWNQEDANIKYQKAIHRLRLFDGVDPYHIMYQIMHDAWRGRLVQFFTGSTIKHFTGESLRKLQFRIAPSKEQQRIVGKLDELFSELDAGVASLKRARALLKKYRQAVLKAAVTGELTRDWRERHEGEIRESGAELLQRILKARRAAWEAAELKKLRAKGKPPKDDGWKQKYKEPQPPDTTALPALPDGWVWASGAQLFDWSSGKFLPTDQMQCGEIAVYGGNGVAGRHDAFLTPYRTLVVGRVGAHCGNVHVTAGPAWITDNAIYATLLPVDCDLEFLAIVFAHANLRQLAQGGAQPFVNQRALNETVVPLPPSSEQDCLSDQVSLEMTNSGKLESEIARCESLISSLRQAILKAAFSGRLVPQDPSDEPASVLLERIGAERAAGPKPARGRRRKVEAGARQLELPR